MTINMIPHYRTSDGIVHGDIDTAVAHERHILVSRALIDRGSLSIADVSATADAICALMPTLKIIFDTDLKNGLDAPAPKMPLRPAGDGLAPVSDQFGQVIRVGDHVRPIVSMQEEDRTAWGDPFTRRVEAIRDGKLALEGIPDLIWSPKAVVLSKAA